MTDAQKRSQSISTALWWWAAVQVVSLSSSITSGGIWAKIKTEITPQIIFPKDIFRWFKLFFITLMYFSNLHFSDQFGFS